MNVLHIVSQYENSQTGRGVRYPALVQECTRRGDFRVRLITGDFDHGRKVRIDARAGRREEVYLPVPAYKGHYSLRRFWSHIVFSARLARHFAANLRRGDVVLVSTIPPESYLISGILTRLKRATMVADVRDVWPDALPLSGIRRVVFNVYCHILNFVGTKAATRAVIVSNSFESWIRRYEKTMRVDFIPLGFDASRWQEAADELGDRSSYDYRYVFVGGLTAQFDLREFDFLVKNEGRGLAIVGGGPLEQTYRKVFPEAEFMGVQSKHEAAKTILMSEFGLIPGSRYASLPNKAFDFLAAGKQVICHENTEVHRFLSQFNLAVNSRSVDAGEVSEQRANHCEGLSQSNIADFEHANLAGKMATLLSEERQ